MVKEKSPGICQCIFFRNDEGGGAGGKEGKLGGEITSKSFPLGVRQSFVLNPNVLVLMQIVTF